MKFVAFLDVLGFKGMVEGLTHEALHKLYQQTFLTVATFSVSNGKIVTVGQVSTPDLSEPLTSCLIVSDSVILWTESLSMKSFINIVSVTGKLLVSGFYVGLPMRGGIAMGDLSDLSMKSPHGQVVVQSVFGKALTEAYHLEMEQQWAGCAITTQCIDQYKAECAKHAGKVEDLATLESLESGKFLVQYPVPMKAGAAKTMWVVNWAKFNRHLPNSSVVASAFVKHEKPSNDKSVQLKIQNTLAFLEHVKS